MPAATADEATNPLAATTSTGRMRAPGASPVNAPPVCLAAMIPAAKVPSPRQSVLAGPPGTTLRPGSTPPARAGAEALTPVATAAASGPPPRGEGPTPAGGRRGRGPGGGR